MAESSRRRNHRAAPDAQHLVQEAVLELNSSAPRQARSLVTDSLAGFPRLDDVVLATSELVTNAVQHGDRAVGRGVTLRLLHSTGGVRVEVSNAGAGVLAVGGFPPPDEMTGRGLAIVAEVTSRMGFSTDGGVTAWFEVDA